MKPNRFIPKFTPLLGMTLAFVTFLLKLYPTSCGLGDCGAVIQSSWGSILGIPVSLYGLIGWAVYLLPFPVALRKSALAALLLGSVYFIGIQVFILHSFCIFCMCHALTTFVMAMYLVRPLPQACTIGYASLYLVGALLLGGAGHASLRYHQSNKILAQVSTAKLTNIPEGVLWLSEEASTQRLVVSLTCSHCLQLLTKAETLPTSQTPAAALIFLTTDENRATTRHFVAAALARAPSEFPVLMAVSRIPNTQTLWDTKTLQSTLNGMIPDYSAFLAEADALLEQHTQFLKTANIQGTPVLVTSGTPTTTFDFVDLTH
jgi:uncharacterized membrane protein